jgi:hypothetical protein
VRVDNDFDFLRQTKSCISVIIGTIGRVDRQIGLDITARCLDEWRNEGLVGTSNDLVADVINQHVIIFGKCVDCPSVRVE